MLKERLTKYAQQEILFEKESHVTCIHTRKKTKMLAFMRIAGVNELYHMFIDDIQIRYLMKKILRMFL